MIFVDDRIGSNDLCNQLQAKGLPSELTRLEFGDVSFVGKGPNDTTLNIGIELKKLPDLVQSIKSGRLAGHQIPGLVGPRGAYDRAWLLVEGEWRVGKHGEVSVPSRFARQWKPLPGAMPASALAKHLFTFELCGGLHVHHAVSRTATLDFLANLYRWWTDTSLDRHTSLLAVHEVQGFLPISDFRSTVMRFPGIGRKLSLSVEKEFRVSETGKGSLRKAVAARPERWAGITGPDGKRIGLKTALRINDFLEGR